MVVLIEQMMGEGNYMKKPILICRRCFTQMDESTLVIEDGKEKFFCAKHGEVHRPRKAKEWRSLLRHDLEEIFDENSRRNLNKDVPHLFFLLDRWEEWIPQISNDYQRHRDTEEHTALSNLVRQFARIIEQGKFKDIKTWEWRKTLQKHLKET